MSKVYLLLFTLIIILVAAPLAAQTETERHYRIELIVVRHLDGSSDSTPQAELRDLSDALDLYAPPLEDSGPDAKPQVEASNMADAGLDPLAEQPEEPMEPPAVRVDEMSDTMREAWRRLRGSAGFRPELFRAWEQSGNEPFPELRIHDDEILFQVDPNDPLANVPVDEHGALVFTDQTLQSQSPAGRTGDDGLEEAALEPMPPRYYFRIDGTARLVRSRFLHLDLDIELREPLFDTGLATPAGADDFQPATDEPASVISLPESAGDPAIRPDAAAKTGPAADASAFRIHHIDQRRQVRTEQMEYFDGPVIGVLALITGFDVVPEEIPVEDFAEGLAEDPEMAE